MCRTGEEKSPFLSVDSVDSVDVSYVGVSLLPTMYSMETSSFGVWEKHQEGEERLDLFV